MVNAIAKQPKPKKSKRPVPLPIRVGWRFFERSKDGLRSANGDLVWPEPRGGKPGDWVRHGGALTLCASGLHNSPTVAGALQHRQGLILGRVESRGECVDGEGEHAGKRTSAEMRVVALYSTRHVVALAGAAAIIALPIFEREWKGDSRPRVAIHAVIEWVRTGTPAAWAAAWAAGAAGAAGAAAGDAAGDAAWAAARAAGAAAGDAAWAAARAAGAAAWAAARAAGAAAGDAAWAAARAAGAAAGDAAGAAAWAAGAAARAAGDAHRARFEAEARVLLDLPEDRLADGLEKLLARVDAEEVKNA